MHLLALPPELLRYIAQLASETAEYEIDDDFDTKGRIIWPLSKVSQVPAKRSAYMALN